ncbi:IMP dehydrogenase [Patescibacteria group bacterium]
MPKAESIMKNKLVHHQALTYDDILLLPGYTQIRRADVDLSVKLHSLINLKLPIISSPMDTVTEADMAIEVAKAGGLGVVHRNLSVSAGADMVKKVKKTKLKSAQDSAIDKKKRLLVAAAVGAGSDLEDRLLALVNASVDMVVVDSSHGYSKYIIDIVKKVKKTYPNMPIMAGNVATYDGAKAMIKAGADCIRVGMGPGAICTTRIITGMGVPQVSAIAACVRAAGGSNVSVIADGGIRQTGDMVKALAFGATAVMLGSMLSGFDQSPGDIEVIDGKKYKMYRGMGSVNAMKKGGAERYGQSRKTDDKNLIAEGVEGFTKYKGDISDFFVQVSGSMRSAYYYQGANNTKDLFKKSRAIKISTAGLVESHPHEVIVKDAGRNYHK